MPKVFVINNSGHDYSKAKRFGELVFLTEGKVDGYAINKNYRELADKLKDVREGDYILVTSLASLNCITGWIIGQLNLPLNLLIFKEDKYLKRKLTPSIIGVHNDTTS